MKKTLLTCVAIMSLGFLTVNIGCSSEPETGSDYVVPEDESPEEEGNIDDDSAANEQFKSIQQGERAEFPPPFLFCDYYS